MRDMMTAGDSGEPAPFTLHLGDCIEVMRAIPDNSVDSIVTDPPYELGFMGKSWDASGIAYSVDMWHEALRVLKPGGHLLAFSGSRTYHRMTVAIEDAGFEIRDQIMWVYGSGFPKSQNISKAIDKQAGAERTGTGEMTRSGSRAARGGEELVGSQSVEAAKWREVTRAATPAAERWEGWGTALKPAHEPICVARKPLIGTVAANVLAFGTGALNIDGCRVHSHDSTGYAYTVQRMAAGADQNKTGKTHQEGVAFEGQTKDGRWPANLIHDGSDEVVALFPESTSGAMKAGTRRAAQDCPGSVCYGTYGGNATSVEIAGSTGSAARFFYCAKTSRADRNEGLEGMPEQPSLKIDPTSAMANDGNRGSGMAANFHPTVKPTDLMAYLVRLVTPPSGLVLDPFVGSGSTGKACMREGFHFVGIDMTPEYVEIARARIEHERRAVEAATEQAAAPKPQLSLFEDAE